MADLYHVYLKPKPEIKFEEIKKKMDLALDWFKYGENIWILHTTSDDKKLYGRFKELVDPSGYLFICKLDLTHNYGLMSEEFWNWIRKYENKSSTNE